MSEVLDTVLEDKRVRGWFLQNEGMLLGKQLLSSAKHTLDLFGKTLTSAVCLQRHAWLHSSDLQYDTRAIIEDLPLEGEGLFSTITDTILKDVTRALKPRIPWVSLPPRLLVRDPGPGFATNIPEHPQTNPGILGRSRV